MQGPVFPSLTPPSGGRGSMSDAPTPDLSGFKGGSRPLSAEGMQDTPAGPGRGTPITPGPPDTAAKAALQGKLDLTPAAGAAKPGGLVGSWPRACGCCCNCVLYWALGSFRMQLLLRGADNLLPQ